MRILQDSPPLVKGHTPTAVLRAERARTVAEIHNAVCRARPQDMRCSMCHDLNERAARLARAAGTDGPDRYCSACDAECGGHR